VSKAIASSARSHGADIFTEQVSWLDRHGFHIRSIP
jgi:hypothetical protein